MLEEAGRGRGHDGLFGQERCALLVCQVLVGVNLIGTMFM